MVKQTAIAGPISRKMGFRLHTEMGDSGEATWAEIAGGEVLGRQVIGGWHGAPPVDIIDYGRRVAYQVKVITDPSHKVAFSGAHKLVKGMRIKGRPTYIGEPQHKLDKIEKWLIGQNLDAYLIVMVLDEDANRVAVFGLHEVKNVTTKDMVPLGTIDNDTGTWHVPRLLEGGLEELGLTWVPHHKEGLPRFPHIPTFLRSSTEGEVMPEIPGVRPLMRRPVRVRGYRRRR